MKETDRATKGDDTRWLSTLLWGLCIVAGCTMLSIGMSGFRSESAHLISATGSASTDFESDLIVWRGMFSAQDKTSKAAYAKIKSDAERIKDYLLSNGISEDEIVFNAVSVSRSTSDIFDKDGNYVRSVEDGYRLQQTVEIASGDIDVVETVSRDITSLLAEGIELESTAPEYYYTDLDDLKIQLIEQATANSRERISAMADGSGSKIGKLCNSNLGVFQITAINSGTGSYSCDGAFDTSSRYKTASITVKLEYKLK
ncbi:hypothetical protein SAMN02910400_00601 [Lachnospiraceae bacterium C10]|nr:hypothetical protein SAMN02910400_00601 [Lachnospiraceae bacterium C10]